MKLEHYNEIDQFVADNIAEINKDSSAFQYKKLKSFFSEKFGESCEPAITETEILLYLAHKLKNDLNDKTKRVQEEILEIEASTKTETKRLLLEYANSHVYYYTDIEKCYEELILKSVYCTYAENSKFRNSMIERLLEYNKYAKKIQTDNQLKYIKNSLRKIIDKSLFLGLNNGFSRSIIDVNYGTQTANEGDYAQFLFLARAILAGFNCSNVDLRSSRYDAVIEYEGKLLRAQVKGISGTSISFKDRDRGGAGIDTSAKRNRGKYISSDDCDIYVAVDKQFGICYLIPTEIISTWIDEGKNSITISKLEDYKENWNIIAEVKRKIFEKEM